MTFKFSFSKKNELIYINEKSYKESIGRLLRQLIDVDWSAVEDQMILLLAGKPTCDSANFMKIQAAVQSQITHPAINDIVENTSNIKELAEVIDRLEVGSRIITYLLESLVDEEQHSYEDRLLFIIDSKTNLELKLFFDSLGIAKMLPVTERNKPLYHSVEDFSFLFETDDIMTLVIQELQFLCSNHFYIRKCPLCKKFFWTNKMNKIYCDRIVPNTKKTCSQLGPAKVWSNNNTEAYSLYWTYRRRLFKRTTNDSNDYCYHQWLSQTEIYRDRARKNEIQVDEMKSVLDAIESRIYNKAACL